MLGVRGLVLAVTDEGATTRTIAPRSTISALGQGDLLGVQYPAWIALAVFAVLVVVLRRTGFGQSLFAIGGRGGRRA